MLGFAPISGQAISGSPFNLVRVVAQMSAAPAVTFAVSGRPGARYHAKAVIGLSFTLAPILKVHQRFVGSVSITFGSNARLRVAGKPIILSAVPQRYDARAKLELFTAAALPERYNPRGAR